MIKQERNEGKRGTILYDKIYNRDEEFVVILFEERVYILFEVNPNDC